MITREDLDKMIDKRTEEYEHLLDHEADKNLDYRYEYALHKGYKAGAQSIATMLLKALEALEWYTKNCEVCFFELIGGDGAPSGYVPYAGNWDLAHNTITEIESMIRGDGK